MNVSFLPLPNELTVPDWEGRQEVCEDSSHHPLPMEFLPFWPQVQILSRLETTELKKMICSHGNNTTKQDEVTMWSLEKDKEDVK